MQEFITYFLNHMPSSDEWVAFLLVNVVAYLAALNAGLRRERRLKEKAYLERAHQADLDRKLHNVLSDELDQRNKDYWVMIQKQAKQIDELTNQLNSAKMVHLN